MTPHGRRALPDPNTYRDAVLCGPDVRRCPTCHEYPAPTENLVWCEVCQGFRIVRTRGAAPLPSQRCTYHILAEQWDPAEPVG
jgi:hypothetical protein